MIRTPHTSSLIAALLLGLALCSAAAQQDPPADPAEQARAAARALAAQAEAAQAAGDQAAALRLHLQAAGGLFGVGDPDGADEQWSRALVLADALDDRARGALARGLLGDLRRKQRRFDEARELLSASSEHIAAMHVPALECFVHDALGQVLMALDDPRAAEAAYADLAAAAPRAGQPGLTALAVSRRATARAEQADPDGARALHAEALGALDEAASAYYVTQVRLAAGQFHEGLGEYDAALELYDAGLLSRPPEATELAVALHGHLGNVHVMRGNYGAARACLERAEQYAGRMPLDTYGPALMEARAQLAFGLGDLHEARRLRERILDEGLHPAGSRAETQTLLNLSNVRRLLHDRNGAVLAATRALHSAPDDELRGRAHHELGSLELEDDDTDAARGHFQQALELDPDNPDLVTLRARLEAAGG